MELFFQFGDLIAGEMAGPFVTVFTGYVLWRTPDNVRVCCLSHRSTFAAIPADGLSL
jgi:hypothetical protein